MTAKGKTRSANELPNQTMITRRLTVVLEDVVVYISHAALRGVSVGVSERGGRDRQRNRRGGRGGCDCNTAGRNRSEESGEGVKTHEVESTAFRSRADVEKGREISLRERNAMMEKREDANSLSSTVRRTLRGIDRRSSSTSGNQRGSTSALSRVLEGGVGVGLRLAGRGCENEAKSSERRSRSVSSLRLG